MGSLDRRLRALEGRGEEAEAVRVLFFTSDGRELARDGQPTGRTWEDFDHGPEAITVQMDFGPLRVPKVYIGINPADV